MRRSALRKVEKHQQCACSEERTARGSFDRQDADQYWRLDLPSHHDRICGQRIGIGANTNCVDKALQLGFCPPVGHAQSPIVHADLVIEDLLGNGVGVEHESQAVNDHCRLPHKVERIGGRRENRSTDHLRKGGCLGEASGDLREDALVLRLEGALFWRSLK